MIVELVVDEYWLVPGDGGGANDGGQKMSFQNAFDADVASALRQSLQYLKEVEEVWLTCFINVTSLHHPIQKVQSLTMPYLGTCDLRSSPTYL